MLSIYFLEIKRDLEKDNYNRLLGYVSEEKRTRLLRFHRFEDAQRSLLGDVLARHAICKIAGVQNSDLLFASNEYGKPMLTEPSGIHFNISHSGKWVVCAVGDSPVGIDVEGVKPVDLGIAERFFSKDEYISLVSQPENQKLKYFYMIWTLKESYIKALGKGLSIPLNSFGFNISGDKIHVIADNQIKEHFFDWSLIESDVIYAVCSLTSENTYPGQRVIKRFLSVEELA